MAPKLRCPECDHRHPLSQVADRQTFRCQSCGRVLKVPERYRAAVEAVNTGEIPKIAGGQVQVESMASAGPGSKLLPPLHPDALEAGLGPLHWAWRLLVWLVAVPLGAVIGGLIANALGLVTLSQMEDAFLDTGIRRFSPLARLVPIWAIATALLVQGAIALVEHLRRRRTEHRQGGGALEVEADASDPDQADDPAGVLAGDARPGRAS